MISATSTFHVTHAQTPIGVVWSPRQAPPPRSLPFNKLKRNGASHKNNEIFFFCHADSEVTSVTSKERFCNLLLCWAIGTQRPGLEPAFGIRFSIAQLPLTDHDTLSGLVFLAAA
jgi:hypothetical protein